MFVGKISLQNERIVTTAIQNTYLHIFLYLKQLKMKKYLAIRIIILGAASLIIWNVAWYFLPKYLQEDQFSGFAELELIFRVSLVFVILFLAFTLFEIYKFQKVRNVVLRNSAIIFGVFIMILFIAIIFFKNIFW